MPQEVAKPFTVAEIRKGMSLMCALLIASLLVWEGNVGEDWH